MIYDLIILGGGPAGYHACERAADKGLKVLLFEEQNLGGVCLNEGCIPTKTFLYSAKLKEGAQNDDKYGIVSDGVFIDHRKVVMRKDKVIKMLQGGIISAFNSKDIEWVQAKAKIAGRNKKNYLVKANGNLYEAKRLLIATGSCVTMPPINGLIDQYREGFAVTSRELLSMNELPDELVVVGGGIIGLEMACYFNAAGCKVTVIEMLEQCGGPIDIDIAKILERNLIKKGIEIKTACKVTKFNKGNIVCEKGNMIETIKADKVLVSIGRESNISGIGLESIEAEIKNSAIITDEYMKTNQFNVYAAGDVIGKSMLAHTAYREAEVAVNNMVGKSDEMKYNAIPYVIYSNPEVAGVGETEKSAKEKGLDVNCMSIPMRYSGRYIAENEGGDGICKIIVDNKNKRLIGVHLIANYASEIIWGAGALIAMKCTVEEIKNFVFPHPTIGEIIREAMFRL